MQLLEINGPRRLDVVERPAPTAGPGELVVEVSACAIAPSDVEAFDRGTVDAPAWFGHEWVGRVVEVGHGVSGHFEGERVLRSAPPRCGRCVPCRRRGTGGPASCERVLSFLVGDGGGTPGFASHVCVPAEAVHRVPEGVDDADATLVGVAAAGLRAVAASGVTIGSVVVVVGAGTMGLVVAQLARLAGAVRVATVDPDRARQELGCDLGCDAAFGSADGARRWLESLDLALGADIVVEGVGEAASAREAVSLVAPGGVVVTVAQGRLRPPTTAGAEPSWRELVARQCTLRTSLGFDRSDVDTVLVALAEDRLRVGPLLGDRIPLAEASSTFETLADAPLVGRRTLVVPA